MSRNVACEGVNDLDSAIEQVPFGDITPEDVMALMTMMERDGQEEGQ